MLPLQAVRHFGSLRTLVVRLGQQRAASDAGFQGFGSRACEPEEMHRAAKALVPKQSQRLKVLVAEVLPVLFAASLIHPLVKGASEGDVTNTIFVVSLIDTAPVSRLLKQCSHTLQIPINPPLEDPMMLH